MHQNIFVTFEGIDGSGKTTAMENTGCLLADNGISAACTREPGGTELGVTLSKLMEENSSCTPETKLCLYLAARAHHIDTVLRPFLRQYDATLCDRFTDSTLVYQKGCGISPGVLSGMCNAISGMLCPDITILLDISAKEAAERIAQRGKDEAPAIEYLETLRNRYLALARYDDHRFWIIDARQSPDKVADQCFRAIRSVLQGKRMAVV